MVSSRKKYKPSDEDIQNALSEVRNKSRSLRCAALHYGIDKSLLSRRLNGKGLNKRGRKTDLTKKQENSLASCLKVMSKWGFGLLRDQVKDVVKTYVQANKIKTSFSADRPGDKWMKNFFARNHLSLKKPEPLEESRRKATSDPFIIYGFFDLLRTVIDENNLMNKPNHVYNLDETSFSSDPSRFKVVGEKGTASHRNIQGSGKKNTTVLSCINAAGKLLPPLIIFQGAKLWTTWHGKNDLPGTYYAVSEKGWMTSKIFFDYFQKLCIHIKERPIVLICDGHLTHLTEDTVTLALKEQITILKLPSHTTDLLQPLDKCCFRPLKQAWDKKLIEWQMANQRSLTPSEFVDLLCSIWHKGITTSSIISAFVSTGIFPVNPSIYPKERFDTSKLEKYYAEHAVLQRPTKANSLIIAQQDASSFSFESILLEKINKSHALRASRRKIDVEAAVITTEEYLDRIREKQRQNNNKTAKNNNKTAKNKTIK